MTSLRQALQDYLRIRRRLGFQLRDTKRHLEQFVDFLEQAGSERITVELAVMWARMPVDAHPHRWSQRLSIVRGFARYLATMTLTARCHPRTCCQRIARVWRPTSTRPRRSRR